MLPFSHGLTPQILEKLATYDSFKMFKGEIENMKRNFELIMFKDA